MAKKLEITDTEIRGLKPQAKPYSKHYGGGFYVFVRPNGRKVCRYTYQVDGKTKRYELGDYVPGKSRLTELKKEYERVHFNRIHNGIDPVAEAEKTAYKQAVELARLEADRLEAERRVLEESGRMSLHDVAQAFLKKYQGLKGGRKPSPRTMQDYQWHLESYILPEFGQYPMDSLPVDKIMNWLTDMAADKPVMANRLFSTLSVVCTWARKQKIYQINANPFTGLDKPGGHEVPKSRVLDFNPKHRRFDNKYEIQRFWNWTESINPVHGAALKMTLLTGQRPGEVLSAEWEDIFSDEWVIPSIKTKTKRDAHRIPMTPKLERLLSDLREISGDTPYLFPATKGTNRVGGESKLKGRPTGKPIKPATLSRQISKALAGKRKDERGKEHTAGVLHGMEKFTPHDLRRTVATYLGGLGFSMEEVGLLLNHSAGVITEIYNRADPTEKKSVMLASWHARLDELIVGKRMDNVRSLRA